jgi:hypothetical protein
MLKDGMQNATVNENKTDKENNANKEKAEILIRELVEFSKQSKFAIEQDDWSYLQEILQKKDGHLRALATLMPTESAAQWGLQELGHELQTCEDAAAAVMAQKLNEASEKRSELNTAKNRVSGVKQMTKMAATSAEGWSADA